MTVTPDTPNGSISASGGCSPGIRPTRLPDPAELSVGSAPSGGTGSPRPAWLSLHSDPEEPGPVRAALQAVTLESQGCPKGPTDAGSRASPAPSGLGRLTGSTRETANQSQAARVGKSPSAKGVLQTERRVQR